MNTHQSILPNFDVFTSPGPIKAPPGGQMLGMPSGRRAASFVMNPGLAAMRGLGQDEPPLSPPAPVMPGQPPASREIPTWAAVLVLGAVGYLSYEIGSAMTPSGSKKTTWGLIGIPVGLFTGPLGLGVMAISSNHFAGRR